MELVSVIIPTYNRKAYVQQAIDSALAQTYPHLEIVVVDDGSTDGTGDALRARYGDRIRYLYQHNQGEAAARNRAIAESSGEYVALLDSDDLWMPTKIARQIALLQDNAELGLVSCHVLTVDAQGHALRTRPLHPQQTTDTVTLESIVLDSPVHASTILVRRSCGDRVGWFDEAIRYGEDWDFCLRVASTCEVGFVPQALVSLRSHADAQSRYLIGPLEAQRRLADRLRIIERALSTPKNEEQDGRLSTLRRKARAAEHVKSAMLRYVHGDLPRAVDSLRQAVRLDPAAWASGARVAQWVTTYATAVSSRDGASAAIDFVRTVYSHLPPSASEWAARYQNPVIAEIHVKEAFRSFRDHDWLDVPRHALAGVRHDPRWLRNRGLFSVAARALLASLLGRTPR